MNTKPRILVTAHLPDAVEARIERDYIATYLTEGADIASSAQGCEALIVIPSDTIDAALMSTLPESIRAIACFSVGYEHVDIGAAKAHGIIVTNTPNVLTDATAEIALLLILATARRASEGERELRSGRWRGIAPTHMMGMELRAKRLGIVGMGRIGQAVATRARAFGMEIHYHNRAPVDGDEATYHPTLGGLLKVSDVLSLHCPLTVETHHLLNADRIDQLPDGAIVINTARGPVVDDDALIAALGSGKLRAAGLDVYDGEPQLNPGYLALDNVTLLPHLGSATVETRTAMGMLALDNLDAIFAGQAPPAQVG